MNRGGLPCCFGHKAGDRAEIYLHVPSLVADLHTTLTCLKSDVGTYVVQWLMP